MISVTELRTGATFKMDDAPFRVIDYKHTKMGRGTASIRVRVRNLLTGAVVDKTFISGARVEPIETEPRVLHYLYREDDEFKFIDPRTFEQVSLPKSTLEGQEKFLKENEEVRVIFWEENPLAVELPITLIFQIATTPPGVKGDSVSASFKPATLDNGLETKVPLFINIGDKIKVDTRTGEYIERVK
ncbi:elongation factor P [Candidatus Shapirobacteria bacterium CG09_land_8_20_14_0_10_47_13]|uniref:Elongation factor P n=1 Tax=Candidatus Shapirobacteria bacterium CG09_land_8_20_14_0_10_47_13 TaxID=1974481 RepID=A0A2H0WMH7_9BACT|nr:MAG: elongation factor P [Candidatus Shapirobacteria bacterium CG09_land_8_20_14_0_10_47_13]